MIHIDNIEQIDLFNGTGGSTKGSASQGVLDDIDERGIKIKRFAGVSINSILFSCYVMGKKDEAKKLILNMQDSYIWGSWWNKPFTVVGLYRAFRSIITNSRPYLGKMVGLKKLLTELIDEETFYKYKNNPLSQDCYVLAVRDDGKSVFWNIKNAKNNTDAIKKIMASSSIPFTTEPILIENRYYIDGGVNDHTPGEKIIPYLIEKGEDLRVIFTIFTRPKGFKLPFKDLMNTGLLKFFSYFLEKLVVRNTSLSDEKLEKLMCDTYKIKYVPVYIPWFTKSLYDTSKETANKGYTLGKKLLSQL